MIMINTHAAKTELSKLLSLVEQKDEVVQIFRNGKPIAEFKPVAKGKDPLKMHPKLKKVIFRQNIASPLTKSDRPEEYR
jgi:antitoxin (DNA-binding transcriptional repressor) of toxin-antitoxin stability system